MNYLWYELNFEVVLNQFDIDIVITEIALGFSSSVFQENVQNMMNMNTILNTKSF